MKLTLFIKKDDWGEKFWIPCGMMENAAQGTRLTIFQYIQPYWYCKPEKIKSEVKKTSEILIIACKSIFLPKSITEEIFGLQIFWPWWRPDEGYFRDVSCDLNLISMYWYRYIADNKKSRPYYIYIMAVWSYDIINLIKSIISG